MTIRSGSFINQISGTSPNTIPQVGMGLTVMHYTDRSAGTITRISKTGKTFWYKADRAIRIDQNGVSESQKYDYQFQPDVKEIACRRRKSGQWYDRFGHKVCLGYRQAYFDFSF